MTFSITFSHRKELLRAIDVRLAAVQQDLMTAFCRATAAGFNLDTVSKLQMFSDQFGAHRLNDACSKFISLYKKRPDLINQWKAVGANEHAVRSSYGSDMSLDEDPTTPEQQCTVLRPISQDLDAMHQQCSHHLDQSSSSINEQLKPSSVGFRLRQSRESSVEPEEKSIEKNDETSSDQPEPTKTSRHIRRLSVQDRINMFENKQKENSGSGAKPIVGKSVELRRLSSDVSVAPSVVEKAVLRRWSGASDMSIDLSGEKKDGESPLCNSSSAYASKSKSEDQVRSGKMELQSVTDQVSDIRLKEHEDLKLHDQHANEREELKQLTASYKKAEDSEFYNSRSNSSTVESDGRKDNVGEKTKSNRSENSLKDRTESKGLFGSFPRDKTIKVDVAIQGNSMDCQGSDETIEAKKRAVHESEIASLKEKNSLPGQFGASASQANYIRSADNAHNHPVQIVHHNHEETQITQSSDHLVPKSRFKAPLKTKGDFGPLESGSISRASLTPQGMGVEGGSSYSQSRSQPLMEIEKVEKEKVDSSEKIDDSLGSRVDNSGFPIMKFKKQGVGADVNKNSQVCIDNKLIVSAGKVADAQEGSASFLTSPAQQVQRARQPKGNQELNDELKLKANELEKLFAEHKQRAPGDHSNPARRSRPAEIPTQQQASSLYRSNVAVNASFQFPDKYTLTEADGSSNSMVKSDSTVMQTGDNKGSTDVLNKNFSELSTSEGSRGKLYETYMHIRDAKLREEWNSKRDEKEAKLKAMQDSLEKTRAKMKAKFSGSSYKDDSISTARRRAERLKSYDSRSILRREKQHLDFDQHDDEDKTKFSEQKQYGEGRYSNETSDAFFEDGVSTSSQVKKLLLAKGSSSSTPRTSAAPASRSAVKATNSNAGRRRFQSENPLAQSVPNFSDMKKENTKLSSAVSKTARSQLKSYARSKNTSEEIPIKEEKSSRSQPLRKSTANLGEFSETSVLNSEDALTLKNEEVLDKVRKNVDSRPFHKRGKSTDVSIRASVPKQISSLGSERMNSDEEYNDAVFVSDNKMNVVKDREEMFENVITEHSTNLDNGESRLSQESGKSADFESENGSHVRTFSHFNPSLPSELPAIIPSRLDSGEHVQDTPGESPMSWNSRAHHPFSYSHEMSDVDASVDSPLGSPVSWNSHSLSQTEADAARMRKKWGTAQKPMLVATSSQNQSRKDMTRGFKRLLKFGRKNRGTESMVDWISATTSEGDDDTEDGRDPANRLSDDLRKSRMSFLQGHPSDDNFNEHEFFAEQVQSLHGSIPTPPANFKLRDDHLSGSSLKAPRSFFSLSTFRNKGTDSKLR
nr:uro-adherence factor A-like [Ipomoea batatas]